MLNGFDFGFLCHDEIVIPIGSIVIFWVLLPHSLAEFQSIFVVHENLSSRTWVHNGWLLSLKFCNSFHQQSCFRSATGWWFAHISDSTRICSLFLFFGCCWVALQALSHNSIVLRFALRISVSVLRSFLRTLPWSRLSISHGFLWAFEFHADDSFEGRWFSEPWIDRQRCCFYIRWRKAFREFEGGLWLRSPFWDSPISLSPLSLDLRALMEVMMLEVGESMMKVVKLYFNNIMTDASFIIILVINVLSRIKLRR